MGKYNGQPVKQFLSKVSAVDSVSLPKDFSYPKISIITPSYNQAQYLEKTIISIINQNYPNLEHIIIDGGSTDGSVEVIKKYEKYITYWHSRKDNGQSDAINMGFKIATGQIIGVQNSDDIYLPGALKTAAMIFHKNTDADFVYGHRLDIDQDDNIIRESRFTSFSKIIYRYDGMCLGSQSTFWKKDVFLKTGYLDTNFNFAMDYDFFLRAAVAGFKFKFTPYYFGAIRRHKLAKTEIFLGTPPHQKELDIIDKKYGRKIIFDKPLKIYSLLYRCINYFLHGDGDYILDGFKRRYKNKSILSGR